MVINIHEKETQAKTASAWDDILNFQNQMRVEVVFGIMRRPPVSIRKQGRGSRMYLVNPLTLTDLTPLS